MTAAGRALGRLHTVAGYLVEERTYQLMPPKESSKWDDQDTSILGGGTRPDISLPVPGTAKYALLDLTATDSQGHIFDKQPNWTGSEKVGDSVEIMYKSIDQSTLLEIMLNKQPFDAEERRKRHEAYEGKQDEKQRERNKTIEFLQSTSKTLNLRHVLGAKTRHLLQHYGILPNKGYGSRLKRGADPQIAEEALQILKQLVIEKNVTSVCKAGNNQSYTKVQLVDFFSRGQHPEDVVLCLAGMQR